MEEGKTGPPPLSTVPLFSLLIGPRVVCLVKSRTMNSAREEKSALPVLIAAEADVAFCREMISSCSFWQFLCRPSAHIPMSVCSTITVQRLLGVLSLSRLSARHQTALARVVDEPPGFARTGSFDRCDCPRFPCVPLRERFMPELGAGDGCLAPRRAATASPGTCARTTAGECCQNHTAPYAYRLPRPVAPR